MATRARGAVAAGVAALAGVAAGVGGFTFVYARGASYLTNDPKACVNCHVMNDQYDGCVKSSHRSVAACNDCHTPHDGTFPEPIRITPRNRAVTEQACRHCRAGVVEAMLAERMGHGGRDAVEAENSTGFHAPQEALRILGQSIDHARQGQLALRQPLVARR